MKLKALLAAGAMTIMSVFALAQPTFAVACPAGSLREGEEATTLSECNLSSTDNDLMTTVNTIINVGVGVIGILAVAFIVIGGFTYVTSEGDAAKVKKAKETIMYGVIGLVISLLAFAIVNFVLSSVFGGGASSTGSDGSGTPAAETPAES